eukprot:387826_1
MKLSISLLLSVLLVYTVYAKHDECSGSESSQPCHCFTGKYECLYQTKCTWKPSSECATREVTLFEEDVIEPTEFPSYEPSPDPTPQPTQFLTIECGDTIHDAWFHEPITWRLTIVSDTSSLELNACDSNFDSILQLYPSARATTPIVASENDCVIGMDHGLSAGEYYLSLSALKDAHVSHPKYEISVTCQYTETPETDDGDNPTQCDEDCDAFKVEMMYYDALSEYKTDYLNISDIAGIEDAFCYTYRVERMFDDGVCKEDVDGIVLGICDTDGPEVDGITIDDTYLNAHIMRQIGGDLYMAYSSNDYMDTITGIKLDMHVSHEPIEFTLCLSGQSGVNMAGVVSHNVQFTRGVHAKKTYLCNDERNDGLPCFNAAAARDSVLPVRKLDLGLANHENSIWSRVLWVIFFVVLSVMGIVSSFYHCVTRRAIVKKPSRLSDLDWAEIKVSDTMSDTEHVDEDEDDYEDRNTERDPLDASTDNDRLSGLSELSGNDMSTAMIELENEKDSIGHLKQAFDDLSKKFAKHTSAERVVHSIRSYRNSVCSTVSENDETTILPVYHDYDVVNADDVGYWASNTDVYTSNNE